MPTYAKHTNSAFNDPPHLPRTKFRTFVPAHTTHQASLAKSWLYVSVRCSMFMCARYHVPTPTPTPPTRIIFGQATRCEIAFHNNLIVYRKSFHLLLPSSSHSGATAVWYKYSNIFFTYDVACVRS